MKTKKDLIETESLMTIVRASEYTGLSKDTIYSYTHKRVLPYYKLRGRKIYFKKQDIDNFIFNKKNLVKSKHQIETEALRNIVSGK